MSEALRIMTAAFSAEDKKRAASLLGDEAFRLVAALRPDADGLRKAGSQPADMLVICTTGIPESEFDFAERLYMTRSDLTIVLLVAKITPAVVESAMLAGIARVVSIADGAEGVKTALLAAASRDKNRKNAQAKISTYNSKIIQFFCPKGGAGKTTLAVNTAVMLAQLGKKVALLDLNLQFGDVGIFLDIDKGDTIADLVEENKFEIKTIKSYLVRHYSGVQVLLASNSPEYAELVKPAHIEAILTTLRSEYDFVVIDASPAFTDCDIAALELSDTVYMVAVEDISTLNNVKRGMKIMDALNVSDKIRLVVNKDGLSSISVRDVESLLALKSTLVLPDDPKTAVRAVNRGIPFVLSDKKAKLTDAVRKFAETLVKEA